MSQPYYFKKTGNKPLHRKALAAALNRNYYYVGAMIRAGFKMPGGLATENEARDWLFKNPSFRQGKKMKYNE